MSPVVVEIDDAADARRQKDRQAFLSLALQMRRNGHEYRRWTAQHTASGHHETAAIFAARADRYASDAIWYWRRGRNT